MLVWYKFLWMYCILVLIHLAGDMGFNLKGLLVFIKIKLEKKIKKR